MEERIEVLVVPHSHWDRAWYWPFERFRSKLCALFEVLFATLEKEPDFQFTLDGQVLLVRDYLEIYPEARAAVAREAQAGRLKLGPMYCLSDVYCTGLEALIRNLLLGIEYARELGGLQETIYFADTFGIIPAMPTICAGFGVKTFIFMRGHPDEAPDPMSMRLLEGESKLSSQTRFFIWDATDGNQVRVLRLRDGYGNACGIGAHPAPGEAEAPAMKGEVERLVAAAKLQQTGGEGTPLLLLAGSDHQFPPSRLAEVMRRANESGPFHFRFANLDDAGKSLGSKAEGELVRYQGEFHGRGASSVLGGTISTRIYLKMRNAEIEQLLVNRAEPSAALARLLGKREASEGILAAAWKHLLLTHPHDDICGCSVDAVHRINETEMEQAHQAADAVMRRMMTAAFTHFGGNAPGDPRPSFALFNAQPRTMKGPVTVTMDYEGQRAWGDIKLPDSYAIVDEQGQAVPFLERSRGPSREHPRMTSELELYPELPAATFSRFYIQERTERTGAGAPGSTIENEFLSVRINPNGTFSIFEKETENKYDNLGFFSDQADAGDSYDFSDLPGQDEECFLEEPFLREAIKPCDGLKAIKVSGSLPVPSKLDHETQIRSAEMSRIPVQMELLLAPGSRQVEVRLSFTNTAEDHRLRWNFGLPRYFTRSIAGMKCAEVERVAGAAPPHDQKPPRIFPEHPGDEFVAVGDEEGGLAIFSAFPFNYELVAHEPQRLALAICRCVNYLTNPHRFSTRIGGAGPETWTPEAQCLGRSFAMKFAIRPFAAKERSRLLFEAQTWRAQPAFGQMDATSAYVERKIAEQKQPFFSSPDEVVLTALKPAQNKSGVVVRLFNPFAEKRTVRLEWQAEGTLTPVRLDESPVGGDSSGTSREIEMMPHGFATFLWNEGRNS